MNLGKPKPRGIKVPATSGARITELAMRAREVLDETSTTFIDLCKLLEFKLHKLGVKYHIVDTDEIEGEEARTIPDEDTILISEGTYSDLQSGDLRARFTIAHEIGHLVVHRGITPSFARTANHQFYEDSEWQADAFAAAFLAPSHLVGENCSSTLDIQRIFGLSARAAEIRAKQLRKQGVINWQ